MKRFTLLLIACFSIIYSFAAYLKDVPVTVTQPDGTVLQCFASGDEFFNYLHDKNGYTIMQHPKTGYYVYAEKRDGKLVATDIVAGTYDPASKGLQPYALISPEEWMARRKAWEVPEKAHQNRDFVPNHGTLNNIVIFIRFSDDNEFTNTFSSIDNMFNDMSGGYGTSMRSYFRAASYGAIDIPTTFYPEPNGNNVISYQDIHPRNYFMPYNATTNPDGYQESERSEREFGLLERAINYITSNNMIPSNLDIDYDNDGYVDNVCFIVRGSTGGWNDLLWPHKWALWDREVYINGKRVWTFNLQLADSGYFKTSTMCHEMNHSLDAPDLYHYNNGTDLHPAGVWDLMDRNSTPPQHCGAYMKMKYGRWIDDIPEITQAGTYTLNPISSATPENVAYKILTDDPQQFYVLEYRDSSVETGLYYGSGLLIYRIDTRFDGNAGYNPDEGIYDEVYIFRPDGTTTSNGSVEQAIFSAGVNRKAFHSSTNPKPFFTDGTVDDIIKIYDISAAGSTISFKYGTTALCEPPTNLSASVNGRSVTLSWDAMENAQSYDIYRDGTLIANTTSTSYTENDLPYGTYHYALRSHDSNGKPSPQTAPVEALVQPVPTELFATMDGNSAILGWTAPEWIYPTVPTDTLTYGDGTHTASMGFLDGSVKMYWGHRFPTETLAEHYNQCIYKVSFFARTEGEYVLYLYEGAVSGDPDRPQTQVYEQSVTVGSGWQDIVLSTPYPIDISTDLWVFMYDPEAKDYASSFGIYDGEYGNYFSTMVPTDGVGNYIYKSSDYESHSVAFLLRTYLGDQYSYSLFDGTSSVSSNVTGSSYTINNLTNNTLHQYTLRTNYNGGVTAPSNKAGIALGSHILSDLNLTKDRMIVAKSSSLTVNGTLTCTTPDHLVLEDGAQLLNNSEGVKATVKKSILPFTTGEKDGWNLIASPVTESLDPDDVEGLIENEYDLYSFSQSAAKEWLNYKAESFSTIDHKTGYLYANNETTTLSFVGTLANTATPTELTLDPETDFAGFNLIGNPYPCNAYIEKPFYVLEYDVENGVTRFVLGSNPIAPCAAVLVQAQTAEERVTFSKEQIEEPSKIAVRLSQPDQKGASSIDQVRIMFQKQCQLAKYPQKDLSSTLYIPQNGNMLAVANADGLSEMPINLKIAKSGTYALCIETEKLDLDYLHLVDNMTGDDVDLLDTPNYTFEANVNDHAWRFRLVFSNREDAVGDNDAFAYVNNGEIIIMGLETQSIAPLQVIDMTGRIVISGDAINRVSTSGMTPGVYVLRLITANGVKTQKIVVE